MAKGNKAKNIMLKILMRCPGGKFFYFVSYNVFQYMYLLVMEVKYVHLRTLHTLVESGTLHFVYLPLDRAKSNQMSHFRFSHL